MCDKLFSNEDTVVHLAHQMVNLAQYYRFDGWLVNIENPINVSFHHDFCSSFSVCMQLHMLCTYCRICGICLSHLQPMLIDNVYTFLSLLTTGVHEVCPHAKIIWYDSVTVDGTLKWQNSLNKMNQ